MMDYDGAWKVALDVYYRPFLRLLFPHIHDDIDWGREPEMLDKEFQRVVPKALRGRGTVDKLVKVWRRDGQEAWVLIHVEVQAKRERQFGRRMHRYNNRIWDRYDRDVVSLGVLADDSRTWRPRRFRRGIWGCHTGITFPVAKLLDYEGREEELQASGNPFAKIVLAHLKTLQTRDDPNLRKDWRLRIAGGLYECGYGAEDVRQLMVLVEWLMGLPPELEMEYEREVQQMEEERIMPYLSRYERNAMVRLIEAQLRVKFGNDGVALVPGIKELRDADKYQALSETITTATTLDEVRRAYAKMAAPPAAPDKKGRRGTRTKP